MSKIEEINLPRVRLEPFVDDTTSLFRGVTALIDVCLRTRLQSRSALQIGPDDDVRLEAMLRFHGARVVHSLDAKATHIVMCDNSKVRAHLPCQH